MLRLMLHVVLFVSIATAQDLLTVLSQQNDLSTFTGLVKQFPTLVEQANGGTFTGMEATQKQKMNFWAE
jgi:hypothetical protein